MPAAASASSLAIRGPTHRVTLPPPPQLAPVDTLTPIDIVRELCAVTTQREAETMAALEVADATLPTFNKSATAPDSPLAIAPTPRGPGQLDLVRPDRPLPCTLPSATRLTHVSPPQSTRATLSSIARRRRRPSQQPLRKRSSPERWFSHTATTAVVTASTRPRLLTSTTRPLSRRWIVSSKMSLVSMCALTAPHTERSVREYRLTPPPPTRTLRR